MRPDAYVQGLLKLIPLRPRGRAREFPGATAYALECWLIGQVMVMILVGVATATSLALLGVLMALCLV